MIVSFRNLISPGNGTYIYDVRDGVLMRAKTFVRRRGKRDEVDSNVDWMYAVCDFSLLEHLSCLYVNKKKDTKCVPNN